jgi:phosphoenolpyruvate-protein phosphotransferase/dihydroxyacetone kinase phosphotransfer subunit
MIGIVVVSHSRALARAAAELAQQMVHGRGVRVAVAAGLDDGTFGTDAVGIKAAIEELDGPDGVLVLMDLGSAVLSAELALDLLDADARGRTVLCPAPLVEGLVVAVVAAAGGAPLAEVAAEATAALAGKHSHLANPAAGPSGIDAAADGQPPADALTGVFVVTNEHGLHARPAARLVGQVRALDATVTLRNLTTGSESVPAGSLSRVATLGALSGHQIEVIATGRQAREAIEHVLALAKRGFDDIPAPAEPPAPSPVAAIPAGTGAGAQAASGPLPAAPGVAVGPARIATMDTPAIVDEPAGDPASEWRRLRAAIAAVRRSTVQLRARTARDLGASEAAIFDAHLMLLDDPDLLGQVRRGIEDGRSAGVAWMDSIGRLESQLAGLADSYQRARAADIRGIGAEVVRGLLGNSVDCGIKEGILIAADLAPAEAAALDPVQVQGIVLAYGSPASHGAILARSLGIPMIVAAGQGVLALADGTPVALDGDVGQLIVNPNDETIDRYLARAQAWHEAEARARELAGEPARTTDGVLIEVGANVGSVADAERARSAGADLAGLVRTEFLFLDRAEAPDVDEQVATYRAVAAALGGRRLTIRTLDVGGDKPLPYWPTGQEVNPFLGLRGIRLSLLHPELLRAQLLAVCRVARDLPVSVMFPMVSTVDELTAALDILDDAIAAAGGTRPPGLQIGTMVEVPAAALKAAAFVPYVDFLSIGTNDLTQYALAAERGNHAVAHLADPLDPAVLSLVDSVIRAASGLPVAVCGEAASDPEAIPLLLGLGVRELSVAPAAVPTVKQAVRGVDLAAATELARKALTAPGAAAVRALIQRG